MKKKNAHPDKKRIAQITDKYMMRFYRITPEVFHRGSGIWVYAEDGTKILDAVSGYGSVGFGHGHPRLMEAGKSFFTADESGCFPVGIVPSTYLNAQVATFAEHACLLFQQELSSTKAIELKLILANGGVEAVEIAIKLARLWGYREKGIAKEKAKTVTCSKHFHGRSITVISASDEATRHEGFGPHAKDAFDIVPFGDVKALEKVFKEDAGKSIVAFLVEPIQGAGGMNIPPSGYLREVRRLCDQYHILMIADEIQTGLGRTGKLLACMHEEVVPDVFILGKILGAGIVPVSAVFAKKEYAIFTPGQDSATYSGGTFAMTIANEVLHILQKEKLCENSAQVGKYLLSGLRTSLLKGKSASLVGEIRGRGLMIGIALKDPDHAPELVNLLFAHGLMTAATNGVLRITPALIMTKEGADVIILHVKKVFTAFVKNK